MSFDEILGQAPAVRTLTRALESGRLHHAYRFEGPDGVGKERVAFAVAQSLMCRAGGALGCGKCPDCRRATTLNEDEPHVPLHPDVLLVQRGLYPASLLGTSSREITGIGVDQVRKIVLSRVGFPPHEGRAIVFIVRDAHELTPSAANALLKTLEEPPPHVHFMLLTSHPNRLLDTIRSRTLPVRFGPLSDDDVATILERHGKPRDAAKLAQGSASAAFDLSDDESSRERDAFVEDALAAVEAPSPAAACDFAAARSAERDVLRRQLFHLAQRIALEGRDLTLRGEPTAVVPARRYAAVLEALNELDLNAQPVMLLESMIGRMRR